MLKRATGVSPIDHGRFQQSALFKRDYVGILHVPICPPVFKLFFHEVK